MNTQSGTSTNKRGIARATAALRSEVLKAFGTVDKPVTVRQMYYLLSTRSAVEKTEAGYRRVQRQLLQMRREQLISYAWISDNTRWMRKPATYAGLREALEQTARFYRQAVWQELPAYVEVWCEKDALAGVLYRVTSKYDVPLMVARGYSSETFAFEAAENMRAMIAAGKECHVYYLGDFDPSGWHAAQDLESRLRGFLGEDEVLATFKRLAVTPQQVTRWKLPARPTKRSDTRHKAFEDAFGAGCASVELDAIHPDTLRALVRRAIEQHIPPGTLDAVHQEETAARQSLTLLLETFAG